MKAPLLLSAAALAVAAPPDPSKLLPKYTIDLDAAPETRFVKVATDHKTYIREILNTLQVMYGRSQVAKDLLTKTKPPPDYVKEMQGIATAVGMDYNHVLMGNMYYEVSGVHSAEPGHPDMDNVTMKSCTSITAQNSNGTVMLARNQDYPTLFSPLMFDAIFTKGGKEVYRGTTYAGTIGLSTGIVPGGWAASINARGAHRPNAATANKQAEAGGAVLPLFVRQAMDHGTTYADAVKYYTTGELIMPGYIIVAGCKPGDGGIITRNYTGGAANNLVTSINTAKTGEGSWYVVQTNDDVTGKPSDSRRNAGIASMEALGPDKVDLLGLWDVLNTPPVFNSATIHTDLTVPATGDYRTYLQHTI